MQKFPEPKSYLNHEFQIYVKDFPEKAEILDWLSMRLLIWAEIVHFLTYG